MCSVPLALVLYGLIKLLKPDYPITPVASYINTPNQKLYKEIIHIPKETQEFNLKFSIKSSVHLAKKLEQTYKFPSELNKS